MHLFLNILYRGVFLLLVFSVSVSVYALQQIYNDTLGEKINVEISQKSLTRIAIRGERINKIISDSTHFDTETDPDSGAVFIRAQNEQAFPLFLTTDAGNTYHLLLTPMAREADNIEIIPRALSAAQVDVWEKRTPYETSMTQLMQGMVNHIPPAGYQLWLDHRVPESIFGNSLKATPLRVYQGKYLQGMVLALTNTGRERLTLTPDLLSYPGVLALVFVDETLAPGQSTTVYQIRLRGSNYA